MKEEQQKDREWDERMAREVLPATRFLLKKLQEDYQKLKKEFDDRRQIDTLQIKQDVKNESDELSFKDSLEQQEPNK